MRTKHTPWVRAVEESEHCDGNNISPRPKKWLDVKLIVVLLLGVTFHRSSVSVTRIDVQLVTSVCGDLDLDDCTSC